MSETSGPFDPVDPENPVAPGEVLAEADWEAMVQHVVDGIPDLPTSTQLKPTVSGSTARGVDLAAGTLLVRGHWYRNSAVKTLTSTANASGAARIDRAVARLNRTTNTVVATLLTGTPGSGTPPALTNDATTTDRPIARWTIETGATAATNLVDERVFLAGPTRLCTSTNRPIDGKFGDLAVETDTGSILRFNGTTWTVVFEDTGRVNLTTSGPTAGANFDAWTVVGPTWCRRIGGRVYIRLEVQRYNTFALGLADPDGSTPFILPAGFRPTETILGFGTNSRLPVTWFAYPDGRLTVYPLVDDIPKGRRVYGYVSYPIG